MTSDPTDPSAAGTDRAPADTDSATSDHTQGVPIVPGLPFLGRGTDGDPDEGQGGPDAGAGAAAHDHPGKGEDTADAVPLNAYPVAVSAVPPSVLQGPTRTVPARVPDGESAEAVPAGEWQPSGVPGKAAAAGAAGAPGKPKAGRNGRSSRREKDTGPEPASALTADRLLIGGKRPPESGWRRLLFTLTFGLVNVGDSDAVRVQRALEHRISVRLGGRTRYVPVLSRKGGVGKTTVTTLLGMALADIREDRIIAMDANPDRGTLSDRSPGRADHTARQLVQNRYTITSFAQLAAYVTRDGSRLHVLASDTDPTVAQAFDDSDYRAVTDLLSRYYSIVLTDSGTGMVHSVMKGTLEKADSVVLVSGGSIDEARLASETLSWLEAHGRQDLVAKAIVVINLSSGSGTQVDVDQIEQHFRSRVTTVVRIPYDRHLAEGSQVDLAKLNPDTRRAVTELAALVVDQLAS